ncbi:MAG: hypothetical protein E7K72_24125 [Roseomonas mucosa]|nr:hypothetical protein [Roseomonas mucosa]
MTDEDRNALKAEVEAAVSARMQEVGPTEFRPGDVARQFAGRAPKATLFRWIQGAVSSGRPAAEYRQAVRGAVTRAEQSGEPAAEVIAAQAVAVMPQPLRPGDITGTGINVIERVKTIIDTYEEVARKCRNEDGTIKNIKGIMQAQSGMREALRLCLQIAEAMREFDQIDRMHTAMVEEIGKESPECAQRIFLRLNEMATQFGG